MDRCIYCGSRAPEWVDPNEYDGVEDFYSAVAIWEEIHDRCEESQ